MSMITNENKKMLWDLLYENKYFDNLPANILENMQPLFESKINEVYSSSTNQNLNLLQMNKLFIGTMVSELEKYKIKPKKVTFQEPNVPLSDNSNHYTREDIQNEKMKTIETVYEKKKHEFENMYANKRPDEIDLSDKTDSEEFNKDINRSFDSTLAEREKELESIRKQYQTQDVKQQAEKWITPKKIDNGKLINQEETKTNTKISDTAQNKLTKDLLNLIQNLQKEVAELKKTQLELKDDIGKLKSNGHLSK